MFGISANTSAVGPIYALEKSWGRRVKINICVLDYSRGALQDLSRTSSTPEVYEGQLVQTRSRPKPKASFLFPVAAHAREDARMIDRPIHWSSSRDSSGCLGKRRRTCKLPKSRENKVFKRLNLNQAVGASWAFNKADNSEIRDRDWQFEWHMLGYHKGDKARLGC